MARDILNRQNDAFGGSFSADDAFVSFVDPNVLGFGKGFNGASDPRFAAGVGLLTQNLQIGYNQQVTRFYEIGTSFHYLVAGRTSGSVSLARVLGPRRVSIAFYRKYGDVCNAATNNLYLTLATGCGSAFFQGGVSGGLADSLGARFQLSILFSVISSIKFSVWGQDMVINEGLQMLYCALNLNDNTSQQLGVTGTLAGSTSPTAPIDGSSVTISGLGGGPGGGGITTNPGTRPPGASVPPGTTGGSIDLGTGVGVGGVLSGAFGFAS